MENSLKEQLQKTMDAIARMKRIIAEKGSKDETVAYLMTETGLPKEECELAFEFYNAIKLP